MWVESQDTKTEPGHVNTKKILLPSSLSMCVVAVLTIVSAILSPSTITIAAAVTAPVGAVIIGFVACFQKHIDAQNPTETGPGDAMSASGVNT